MSYNPNPNQIFLSSKTYFSLKMDGNTLNSLRCFLGDALEEGMWKEFPEEQKLMWELHDSIVMQDKYDQSAIISPTSDWGDQRKKKDEEFISSFWDESKSKKKKKKRKKNAK